MDVIDSHLIVTENAHGLRTHASLAWVNSIASLAVVFAHKFPVKLCHKAMLYPWENGLVQRVQIKEKHMM